MLREARTRHGRARLGYAWAIIEPLAMITFLTVLFLSSERQVAQTAILLCFFATGVLAFQAYRNTSVYICNAFVQNKSLFNYPMVKTDRRGSFPVYSSTVQHMFL